MPAPAECRTVSIAIRRRASDVYDYIAHIENFPRWSAFVRHVKPDGADWIFETTNGCVRVRFEAPNNLGVLDHTVTLASGQQVHVPLRVVSNGAAHSEVLFTIFRLPGMNDQQFADDIALVLADLGSLKRVLET